jgi:uncharacterized RDD family membrane protein YckC
VNFSIKSRRRKTEISEHQSFRRAIATATVGGNRVVTGTPAIVLMLVTALYWNIPEWILGATLGKLIFGLRVRALTGQQISLGQSFRRNLLRLVDFSPFYLTGFLVAKLTPSHQRLGDLWAKTIVVNLRNDINESAAAAPIVG